MNDRRKSAREEESDRRRSPRPSLRLNLTLLGVALLLGLAAWGHRLWINRTFDRVVVSNTSISAEVAAIRAELLAANLSEQQLRRELESRLSFEESLNAEEFYLALYPDDKVLRFNYGDSVVREAPLTVGQPLTVSGPEGTWTFPEFRGASHVEKKVRGGSWTPEPWAYRMKGEAAPENPGSVANGLGEYVIELPNGYLIHSAPAEESPLDGPKPASFMVPAEDLAAIWPRIEKDMNVYVF